MQKTNLELRKLPVVEFYAALSSDYPSAQPPLFCVKDGFYMPFKKLIAQNMSKLWSEGTPCLYDVFIYIQDSLVTDLLNDFPELLPQSADGNIRLEFQTTKQFEIVFDQSYVSFKRSFDNEEHYCKICSRNLLGYKFIFLSGCEHFYCTECIQTLVTQKICEGQVGNILCPEQGCGRQINDWDIRNMGLSKADRERYEQLSLNNAIADMDDVGWCPVQGCGSIANIDKEDNTGRCQHCEFHFCLDCKDHVHPFKRCKINRLDLMDKFKSAADSIQTENLRYESMLTDLYFKKCTKLCPNPRC